MGLLDSAKNILAMVKKYNYNEYPYITLSDDSENIRYCAVCWGRDKKLIQLYDELNCEECIRLRRK